MRVLAGVAGITVVVVTLASMVGTLVSTRQRSSRRGITGRVGHGLWILFRTVGMRIGGERRRETVLAAFSPTFVLGLLMCWVALQVVGWGLLWWAIGGTGPGLDLGESFYFSGVVYFTVGFGEVVPVSGWARWLAIVEAFGGVTLVALVIGYLPTLYAAYAERERLLSTLDDGSEDRITPLSLVLEMMDGDDVSSMDPFFERWELWAAGVLESHTTHPMLAYFRSQDPQQSWVTALGLVADAATVVVVTTGEESGPAFRSLRRATRAFTTIAATLGIEPKEIDPLPAEQAQLAYDAWTGAGLTIHGERDAAAERLRALRAPYAGAMEAMIDELVAPRGFWGHRVGRRGTGRGAEHGLGR